MVVVFGEVQFEHRAFGATVLNGVDRIQAVGRLFNSLVFVVVRIRIALPGRRFSIPCVNVGSADGEAWKIPVFQVIHRTEEDRFFAVSVEVGTVIPPDIQAAVGGSVGWSHTLQEVSLLTVSLNPGTFEAQIHYVSRPVTKGQRLQPSGAVIKIVDAAIVNFIARTIELVAGG